MEPQLNLWNEFCNQYFQNKSAIPLFSTEGKIVNSKLYGQNNRILLKRSDQMEALAIEEVSKVLADFKQKTNIYEGLIYIKINLKYKKWANRLFESYPTPYPTLRRATYFWIHAWENGRVGIWKEFGSTSLTALEYHLISVASTVFPDSLLNQEGVNRKGKS